MPKIGYRTVALLVGATLISLTLVAFLMVRSAQQSHIDNHTETNIRLFLVKLESSIREKFMVADLFRDQLEKTRLPYTERFELNARAVYPLLPDLEAMNWVNPDGIVEATYPDTEAVTYVGQDLTGREGHVRAMNEARISREPRLTGPVNIAQGEIGFEGFTPVFRQETHGGYLHLVVRASPLIEGVIGPWQGQDYNVAIADGEDAVYGNLPLLAQDTFAMVTEISVAGRTWTIALAPTAVEIRHTMTLLDELVLAGGIMVSLLASFLIICAGRNQEKIRYREERFALAMQGATDGLYDHDLRTDDIYLSPRWFRMLGYEPDDFPQGVDTTTKLIHPDDLPKLETEIERLQQTGETHFEREIRMRHRDGSWRTILSRAFMVFNKGEATRLVGTNIDITADRERERVLREATRTDHLTGLRNRRELRRDLTRMFNDLQEGERLAVFHLDLDRFKAINDSHGHQVGDTALCEVARRLRDMDTEFSIIARVGGDEFVLVRPGSDTDDDIRTIAAQIMDRITDPISVSGKQIRLGASVGVSFAACGSRSNIIDTLEDADIALIRAKEAGRGRCRFFEPQMRDEAVRRARMQQEITLGLQRDEFTAHFQPQIDIGTGNVIGFEALARWEHPARGTLTAGEFIGFIDSTSLAGKLDRQVLHLACLALEILERAGHSDITISVNISTEQLREPGIAGVLSDVVRRAGARPACLHLEILETTLLDSASPTVIDNIRDLADRGFPIELDDFGTGHTAISSILNFPISRIKIAGSLITGVDGDLRRQAVVHSIVELGENLNVEVLAEGMETAAEVAFLKSISCRTGQGFYLAAPVPIDELVERIELQSTDAAATPEPDLELSDEGV